MKTINATKLEGMGIERVRAACIVHATKALKAQDHGDAQGVELHTSLLDQCAVVGRRLLKNEEARYTAGSAIKLFH